MDRYGALALACLLLATTGTLLIQTTSAAVEGDLEAAGNDVLRTLKSDEMDTLVSDADGNGRQPLGYKERHDDDDDHSSSYDSDDDDDDGKYNNGYHRSHSSLKKVRKTRQSGPYKGYSYGSSKKYGSRTRVGSKHHKRGDSYGRKLMGYKRPGSYGHDDDDDGKYNSGYYRSYSSPKKTSKARRSGSYKRYSNGAKPKKHGIKTRYGSKHYKGKQSSGSYHGK